MKNLPALVLTHRALQSAWWNNRCMVIGDRLPELCEAKKLSQGDIEKRTGLLRCYISRVENGHMLAPLFLDW
jgi:hypothetical protein